jgi:hypothetical protein
MLREYSEHNNVEINLVLKHPQQKRAGLWDMFLPGKAKSYFKRTDIVQYFPVVSAIPDALLLGFVSRETKELNPEFKGCRNSFFIEKGNRIASAGPGGVYFFIWYFLALLQPLSIKQPSSGNKFQAFFQVASFSLVKNTGYLRFNIEKILDHLIYDKTLAFSQGKEFQMSLRIIGRTLVYPFREFFQKIQNRILKSRWRLIQMDLFPLQKKGKPNFKVVNPPKDKEWADPMLVDSGRGLFLFMEEVVENKGHLSVAEVDRNSLDFISSQETILNHSTHLSYPHVFEVNNQWFLIPESSQAKQLAIYRAVNFPVKWELFREVFSSQKWLDTTTFYYNGKWWIFSVHKPKDYASSYQDLYLFYSNDILLGEWVAHPCNPIVSDIRYARPGGALFQHEGRIFRPAQNCLERYGGGISFCEVTKLSEYEYEERVVREFYFPWYNKLRHFHTVAVHGNKVIGDCKF